MRRSWTVWAGLLMCMLLAACTTDPATEITASAATLNGTGATAQGSVAYSFQWATDAADLGTSRGHETPVVKTLPPGTRDLTAFSYRLTGLAPDTQYVYRTCGRADGNTAPECDPGVSFTTESTICQDGSACTTEPPVFPAGSPSGTLRASGFPSGRPLYTWFKLRMLDQEGKLLSTDETPRRGPAVLTEGTFSEQYDTFRQRQDYTVQACATEAADGVGTCAPAVTFRTPLTLCQTYCWVDDISGVTETAATFHAVGFTSALPVTRFFRYYENDSGGGQERTTPRVGPATLPPDGSFSATATGLTPDTAYVVRACVVTAENPEGTCNEVSGFFITAGVVSDVCGDRQTAGHCVFTTVDRGATAATVEVTGLTTTKAYDAWLDTGGPFIDPETVVRSATQRLAPGTTSITAQLNGISSEPHSQNVRLCLRAVGETHVGCTGPADLDAPEAAAKATPSR